MQEKLDAKIAQIKTIKNFDYLLNEFQDEAKITKYYRTNKLAYTLFNNRLGYMHMGLSENGEFDHADFQGQAKFVAAEIKASGAQDVLELGYGQGANLNYLSRAFPDVKLVGIDLSTPPRKKYAQAKNVEFIRGDYHSIDTLGRQFDIIYAIETLCYSCDLKKLFASILAALKDGGKLIVFDGYRDKAENQMSANEQLGFVLAEKGMSVNRFPNIAEFVKAAEDQGLKLVSNQNISEQIMPSLKRLEHRAGKYFTKPLFAKLVNTFLPEIFVRNTLAGYLMLDLFELKTAGYYLTIFKK